jgi:saccharopine dehydrogenase-like NADP-dependent oxidoreductase
MSVILVVGAGGQGGPCASILARDDQFSEIRLGDLDPELARKVSEKIGSDKVKPLALDARQKGDIAKAADGADVIINLTLVDFNETILEAALEAGTHYVDTACSYAYLVQMTSWTKPLRYEREFGDLGKTALMGCGATPGVTNVLARYVCDQLDEVERIYVRCGYVQLGETDEVVGPWNPGWSPEIALGDYAEPPMVFEGGQYKTVPIFSRAERHRFAEPIGEDLLTSHSHEEPYTLPYYLGKGVREVDFKYPVDPIAGALVKMGFADDKAIDVNGVKVVPRDVLMKLVERPSSGFLQESEAAIKASTDFAWAMEIAVDGVKNGSRLSHVVSSPATYDTQTKLDLYHRFGSFNIGVALPAVVGAKMCLGGHTDAGVISSECLEPRQFLQISAEMGAPVEFDERIAEAAASEERGA